MSLSNIELEITYSPYPSYSRTLKERKAGCVQWIDVQREHLILETDCLNFYKNVASYICELTNNGKAITKLSDVSS